MIRAIVLLSLTLAGSPTTCLFSQVVYVANTTSGDISAFGVDAGSGALTAITGSPFAAGGVNATGIGAQGPVGVAVDPMGKFVYVSNGGFGNISAYTVNTVSGALTAIPGSPFAIGSFTELGPLAVDPTGKFLYVTNVSGSFGNIVTLNINVSSGVLTGFPVRPPFIDMGTGALVVSPAGKFVYATGSLGGVLAYTANAGSGALTAVPGSPFPAGIGPTGVTMDPTGKFVYVPNSSLCASCASGNVSAYTINAGSGALTPIAGSPFQDAGLGPFGAAVDPTGKFLYVSNVLSGSVSAYTINANSGALTAVTGSPFPAGSQPEAVAVDPSGKFLYVANYFSNTISAYTINSSSGALTPVPGSPFAVGKAPAAIAIRSQAITPSVAITAIAPSSVTAGGPAFTLTVTGMGSFPARRCSGTDRLLRRQLLAPRS